MTWSTLSPATPAALIVPGAATQAIGRLRTKGLEDGQYWYKLGDDGADDGTSSWNVESVEEEASMDEFPTQETGAIWH